MVGVLGGAQGRRRGRPHQHAPHRRRARASPRSRRGAGRADRHRAGAGGPRAWAAPLGHARTRDRGAPPRCRRRRAPGCGTWRDPTTPAPSRSRSPGTTSPTSSTRRAPRGCPRVSPSGTATWRSSPARPTPPIRVSAWLHASPLFTFAGIGFIYNPMQLGLFGVFQPKFDAGRWLEVVDELRPQFVFLVPSMAQLIVAHPAFRPRPSCPPSPSAPSGAHRSLPPPCAPCRSACPRRRSPTATA